MSTTTEPPVTEISFEIVPSELALPPEEKQSLIQSFSPLLAKAKELLEESKGITSAKLARVSRLQFRKLRSDSEALRKSTKEHHLRMGKAIDGAHAILVAAVASEEKRMNDIETAEEKREEERIEGIRLARHDLLVPLGVHESIANNSGLGRMADEAFAALLTDSRALHEARLERERKEAEEALAKQVAEAQAREKIRLDNERLLKEAAEREEAARVEREVAAKEKAALEAKLAQERAEAEAKAAEEAKRVQAEKEEAARVAAELLRKAQEAAEAEKREAEAKAEYERRQVQAQLAHAEAVAKREREALEAKNRAAQQAQEAKLAEAKRLHDELVEKQRLDREIAAEKERIMREALEAQIAADNARAHREKLEAEAKQRAEEAKKREAEEAAEAALLAPDKDKLMSLALAVRGILLPKVKAAKAVKALASFETKIQNLADWIEEKAGEL